VRGGLPGERVTVRVTDDSRKSFWRGEVAEVLRPAADEDDPAVEAAHRPPAGGDGGELDGFGQVGHYRGPLRHVCCTRARLPRAESDDRSW
ncbi:hypothetical protein, partial [Bacillus cereus group sp. Bce015]|uniref:hypothetical protein n=1 Tax=Bacillus cereus group sp. Bce015 TaxID=3445249 RepID=UPI003F25787B